MNELLYLKEQKLENGCTIKPILDFDCFSDIINVFSEPPFSEPLTLEDKLNEFKGYIKNGLALGYFSPEGDIMGFAGIMKEVEDEHQEYFHEDVLKLNPLYIYGLATKKEYRGKGACSNLVETVINMSKDLNFDYIYMRISAVGSMSEGLCRDRNFTDLLCNGKKIIQSVEFERNDPTLPNVDERSFLVLPITELGYSALAEHKAIEKQKTYIKK